MLLKNRHHLKYPMNHLSLMNRKNRLFLRYQRWMIDHCCLLFLLYHLNLNYLKYLKSEMLLKILPDR
jgi:hypothetical protein